MSHKPTSTVQEEKKRLRIRPLAFGVSDHEPFKVTHDVTPRPRPPTPPPMFSTFEMEAAKVTPGPPPSSAGFAMFEMDHKARPTPTNPPSSSSFSTFEMSEPLRERPRPRPQPPQVDNLTSYRIHYKELPEVGLTRNHATYGKSFYLYRLCNS